MYERLRLAGEGFNVLTNGLLGRAGRCSAREIEACRRRAAAESPTRPPYRLSGPSRKASFLGRARDFLIRRQWGGGALRRLVDHAHMADDDVPALGPPHPGLRLAADLAGRPAEQRG